MLAQFDPELLRRYDRPGPRYTSYPTAPHFNDQFNETAFRAALARSNDDPIPRRLSLYLHVPFCASPCFYCGCNRVITRDLSRGERYAEAISAEIARTGALIDRDRPVMQIHFGGGTPNFLTPPQLGELMARIATHFRTGTGADRDFSIELDPRFIDPIGVRALAEVGFNRASLGVQDFDPAVQQAINREQSVEQTERVVKACRDSGFRSINLDLIYGLPLQRPNTFATTLDRVLEMRPDRLAIYSYAHMPQLFKAARQIHDEDLPSAEMKLSLLGLAIEKLSDAGYQYIGMDHFALPTDELAIAQQEGSLHRNFMGYTTHADCDLIGLGVSAISHVGDTFSQNHRDLPSYHAAIDSGRLPTWRGLRMDRDDCLRAELIQQLMCHGEIDGNRLAQSYDIDFEQYFADALRALQPLEQDGLVERAGSRLRALPRGRMLLRNVAMCFDRYLGGQVTGFSRAI